MGLHYLTTELAIPSSQRIIELSFQISDSGGLSQRFAISRFAIAAGVSVAGWTRGIQSAKALAKREDTSIVTTPVEAVAISMQ
jgi:hypothetical protein